MSAELTLVNSKFTEARSNLIKVKCQYHPKLIANQEESVFKIC